MIYYIPSIDIDCCLTNRTDTFRMNDKLIDLILVPMQLQ